MNDGNICWNFGIGLEARGSQVEEKAPTCRSSLAAIKARKGSPPCLLCRKHPEDLSNITNTTQSCNFSSKIFDKSLNGTSGDGTSTTLNQPTEERENCLKESQYFFEDILLGKHQQNETKSLSKDEVQQNFIGNGFPFIERRLSSGFEGVRAIWRISYRDYSFIGQQISRLMEGQVTCKSDDGIGAFLQLDGRKLKKHKNIAFVRIFLSNPDPKWKEVKKHLSFISIVGRSESDIVDLLLDDSNRKNLDLSCLLNSRPERVNAFSRERWSYKLHPIVTQFVKIFLPNTLNCITWSSVNGWKTTNQKVKKEWVIKHLDPQNSGSFDWSNVWHLGSAPHPGGWWDHDNKKWHGGLKVPYISWDFDCCEGDKHLKHALMMRDFFRRAGFDLTLINSSHIIKNGASFPGIRAVAILCKPLFYSVFKWLSESILDIALGSPEKKGTVEIYPSSSRGSRVPFGAGSAIFDVVDNRIEWFEDTQKNIETLLGNVVDLEAVATFWGQKLSCAPKDVFKPWLSYTNSFFIKQFAARKAHFYAGSLSFKKRVELLLETGLTHSGHRFEALQMLVAYYRILGKSRGATIGHILDFLWNNHNSQSNFINKSGTSKLCEWVRQSVHLLWSKAFKHEGNPLLLKSKEADSQNDVLGRIRFTLNSIDISQIQLLIKNYEGMEVPRGFEEFIVDVMSILKARILKSKGTPFYVSSKVFRKASKNKKYSHYLKLAEMIGFFRVSNHSYRVKDRRRCGKYPPYTKKYESSFIFLSQYFFSIHPNPLLSQRSTQQPLGCFSLSFLAPKLFEGCLGCSNNKIRLSALLFGVNKLSSVFLFNQQNTPREKILSLILDRALSSKLLDLNESFFVKLSCLLYVFQTRENCRGPPL